MIVKGNEPITQHQVIKSSSINRGFKPSLPDNVHLNRYQGNVEVLSKVPLNATVLTLPSHPIFPLDIEEVIHLVDNDLQLTTRTQPFNPDPTC